jgi:hypothetical protein
MAFLKGSIASPTIALELDEAAKIGVRGVA